MFFQAASAFMTHTHGKAPLHGAKDSSFCFGLDAPVASVPPGYGANFCNAFFRFPSPILLAP